MAELERTGRPPEVVLRAARTPELKEARATAAASAAPKLRKAGALARELGHDADENSAEGPAVADDAMAGVGVLTQIGADLLGAAGTLLSGTNPYAGAALLRQVVEVEYLTWAFANEKRDAAAWLRSTSEDRRKLFTPAGLRKECAGLFLSADYGHHCEQGGHPVPRAVPLLGVAASVHSQLLLVDLLLHGWRTSDNLIVWTRSRDALRPLGELQSAQSDFANWGRMDPMYMWAVQQRPNPTAEAPG